MTAPEIRVLTVRQPWAWAIVHGGKDVENRSRNLAGDYRGLVAIHAAKTTAVLTPEQEALLKQCEGLGDWFGGEPIVGGAIIGVVELVDAHHGHYRSGQCSRWAQADVWHLLLRNPRPLSDPIPFKGALGLRRLPDDVTALLTACLDLTQDVTP